MRILVWDERWRRQRKKNIPYTGDRARYELENSHANHQVNHRRATQHRYLNDIYLATRLFVLLVLFLEWVNKRTWLEWWGRRCNQCSNPPETFRASSGGKMKLKSISISIQGLCKNNNPFQDAKCIFFLPTIKINLFFLFEL